MSTLAPPCEAPCHDNPVGLITTLQAGLADPSHQEFVQQLAAQQQSAESRPA